MTTLPAPAAPPRADGEALARWGELDSLVGRARGRRAAALAVEDALRLASLYRRTAGDLARVRSERPGDPLADRLEALLRRAHPLVHRAPPLRLGDLPGAVAVGVPRSFRATSRYVLVSLGVSLAGVVAGWVAVSLRQDLAASLAPQTSLFDRMARGEVPPGTDVGLGTAVAIILNNMRVALVAFAGGALLGIPTVLALLANGWTLGTLGAVEHRDGLDTAFWSYIAPHGVIELSIIVFAGATGLMLADAILRPGLATRGDALAARSGTAATLVCVEACLLVVCGLIEGLVSPTDAPEALKYGIGAATGAALYGWLLLAGRARPRGTRSPAVAAAWRGTPAGADLGP